MSKLQAKAIFLSFIMLLMMTHDAFPHTHHNHEVPQVVVKAEHSHNHHHHGTFHHHPDRLPETGDEDNLLGLLFKRHSHNTKEYHVAAPAIQSFGCCKAQFVTCFIASESLSIGRATFNILHRNFTFPPESIEKACLTANSLRAPPVVG